MRREQAPILAELEVVGIYLRNVCDLHRDMPDYPLAVPILIKWLPVVTNPGLKDDIARTLSSRLARAASKPLVEEFRRCKDQPGGLKWTLAAALSFAADDSVFEDLAELANDKRHGKNREMLAIALGNMRDARAVDVLIDLLSDNEIAGHAIIGLGNLRNRKARPYIEPFLTHPKTWWRNEAKKALAKIDTAERRRAAKQQKPKG